MENVQICDILTEYEKKTFLNRSQTMKLYIVRHGETEWNKAHKIQGKVDIPLNEFGRKLARKTAEGLKAINFDLCYSSPLSRARETAELILAGRLTQIIEDERIMEMAFGEYEGRCCSESGWDLPEEFRRFFDGPQRYEPVEGGEDFSQVKKRTGEFLQELYEKKEYQNYNILIATHGAALAGLLNNIKGESLAEYWGEGVHKNCAVTEVEVVDGKPEIISENVVYYDDEVKPWGQ
ncbi:phosphoserine phosphatase 1 [Lachnospiraceae bacterium]|jgi:broad specificity phosphatase PhoE|nr:phosphoserine phosphatase 1 [Lachnospiraceae bacterium]